MTTGNGGGDVYVEYERFKLLLYISMIGLKVWTVGLVGEITRDNGASSMGASLSAKE